MAIYRGPGGSGDATTDAASQATVATTKAAEAATSASAASSSASAAATSASNASTSAGNSETSKIAAVAAQAAAELAETNAETAQTAAEAAQSAAELAETNAETAQTAAETAQTAAELAETNAETAQTAAETAQTAAELAETNAETAETNAANSATAAATSANDAATSYDSFDDRYLGAKATPPTLDNDGDALLTGALYWNTGSNQLFVWDGSAWEEAAFSISGSVTSFNTRTGAVTLSSADVTNVGALMDSELTSEASVKALDQGVATTDSPSFAGLTTTADISFGDNDKAIFGNAFDLQIYHNGGSNSLISCDESHSLYIEAGSIFLNKGIDESMITAVGDGAVSLYYDNAKKLATTATGIDVTGTVVSDGLTVASDSTYAIDVSRPSAGNTTLRITGGSTAGNDAVLRADIANTTGTSAVYFGDSTTNGIGRIMYEHNGDYMRFYTSSTEKMRIDSSGNVGIGTTSPTTALSIVRNSGAGSFASIPYISIKNELTVANPYSFAGVYIEESVAGVQFRTEVTGTGLYGGPAALLRVQSAHPLAFRTDDTERMRITSAGNVGIGTSSPAAQLDVVGTVRLTNTANASNNSNIRDGGGLVVEAGNSNPIYFYTGGSEKARITSAGNVGIGNTAPQELLHLQKTGGATIRFQNPGQRVWSIGNDGTSFVIDDVTGAAERMRIDSSGNVGIGTASPVKRLTISGASNGNITTLTDAATITPNLDSSDMFTVTLNGNRTLANPSNRDAGQTGSIFIVQDGTGSRTLAWGSYWDFAGGTAPTLSTAAGAVDRVDFIVRTSTSIHAVFTANYS